MATQGRETTLVVGAVAYDPKVVSIWEGFKSWFTKRGLGLDYVLYSNYERLVESLLAGGVHVAWNSPLAWVRARRLASSAGVEVRALAMRDTDCDLHSVVVVRADDDIRSVEDLRGRKIGVGAPDSPQATLLPLATLRSRGLEGGRDFTLRAFDVLGGKHGDHVGGERDAARALASGEVDAACLIEGNYRQFENENLFDPHGSLVVARTELYDHCNFTITSASPENLVAEFKRLLLGMSYDDPEVRPLLELEGLRAWVPGRTRLYEPLEGAVDQAGFYDKAGRITASGYRF
jgi:phosphonate transport system substrate-binding protein